MIVDEFVKSEEFVKSLCLKIYWEVQSYAENRSHMMFEMHTLSDCSVIKLTCCQSEISYILSYRVINGTSLISHHPKRKRWNKKSTKGTSFSHNSDNYVKHRNITTAGLTAMLQEPSTKFSERKCRKKEELNKSENKTDDKSSIFFKLPSVQLNKEWKDSQVMTTQRR